MNQQYEQLYKDMLADIERTIKTQLPESENVENCFWVAKNYWEQLKKIVREKPFANDIEEINFFREVKPKFTSQIQFFYNLSERLLFIPSGTEEQTEYWQKETERYKTFYDKNEVFIRFYESGSEYLNDLYFKRVKDELKSLVKTVFFDEDLAFCSSHDYLVREFLSHKMYYEYARNKLYSLAESADKNETSN